MDAKPKVNLNRTYNQASTITEYIILKHDALSGLNKRFYF